MANELGDKKPNTHSQRLRNTIGGNSKQHLQILITFYCKNGTGGLPLLQARENILHLRTMNKREFIRLRSLLERIIHREKLKKNHQKVINLLLIKQANGKAASSYQSIGRYTS